LARRAEEFLDSHLDEPVTIREICRAVGGRSRTLHIAFQECFGISPVKYAKDLRLNAVRRQLLNAAPGITVTDVAMRWGFFHLGRFSQQYRSRFGEYPSATLRNRVCAVETKRVAFRSSASARPNGVAA
jgi:AraC family ethanolamine operon transcriptional activator